MTSKTASQRETVEGIASLPHPIYDDSRSLLAGLPSVMHSLSRVARRVGEYILKDPERVLCSSIDDIQHGSGASAGAILRFCHTVGAKGLLDLKIRMAKELAQAKLAQSTEQRVQIVPPCVFANVLQLHSQDLRDLVRLNPPETLEKISTLVQAASRIEFFSIGMSYPVAYVACNMLRFIGISTAIQSDSHLQIIAATQLTEGDIGFGISRSGRTYETVKCLQIAQEAKATTLCITSCVASPITAYSDLVLYATPEIVDTFTVPVTSSVTQLALIDALFISIAGSRKRKATRHLQFAHETLLKYRPRPPKNPRKASMASGPSQLDLAREP